jgi:uncharacterized protein (TIGR02246 family)
MRSKWIGWIGAVAMAVAVGACGGPQVKEFGKQDQEAIRALVQDFAAAYNAKDVEKLVTHFSGGAVLMPANRSTLRGVELVKTYYQERFEAGAGELVLEPQDVSGHGPLGYVTAYFTLRITPPDGGEPRSDRGKVLWIVRNLGGNWKFEYQIMSSDLPPVVPAPAAAPAK